MNHRVTVMCHVRRIKIFTYQAYTSQSCRCSTKSLLRSQCYTSRHKFDSLDRTPCRSGRETGNLVPKKT